MQASQAPASKIGQEQYTGYSPLSPVSAQSATPAATPVTIEKAAASNVYSPFGRMENMNTEAEVPQNPQTSREILFGGDPIENFKKNGMFDPNSKANNRPMDPVVSMTPPTNTSFVPSYTKAYEEDFNEEKPTYRSVTNFTPAQEPAPEETIEPLPYMEEPITYQEPTSPIVETPILETPREEYLDFGRESEKDIPVEPIEEKPYRRHDFMDLFSPQNPRLLEEIEEPVERTDNFTVKGFGEEEPMLSRDRAESVFERNEILKTRIKQVQ